MKAGALGEHPAGENPQLLAGKRDLVHLHESCGMGRLRGRPGVADARRHFERAKIDRLVDGDLQMRDSARHLVQGGEDSDRVLDGLGLNDTRLCGHGQYDGRTGHASKECLPIHENPSALRHPRGQASSPGPSVVSAPGYAPLASKASSIIGATVWHEGAKVRALGIDPIPRHCARR